MISVVYWNNIPAPYMVDRFNAVARRGTLDFEAWFSARSEAGRSWGVDEGKWEFSYRYLPSIARGAYPLAVPTPLFRGRVPDILVSLYAAPSFVLGWALGRRLGARTAFWVEITYDAWVRRRRWKEAVKAMILPRADGILTAGNDGRSYASRYGVDDARVFTVPHMIDFAHYADASNLECEERNSIRKELDLHGVTFVYVGRLWSGKGLDFLLDAFFALQRQDLAESTLLIVGDGPHEEFFRRKAAGSSRVVFAGFHHEETLPRLYAASDVFVFPTLGDPFGMVVSEAMACGLPVISTSASGEIHDRIEDGVNGFIVPPANVEELLNRMTVLMRDPARRARMGKASFAKVAGQSPDVWAEIFERAVEGILSLPRSAAGPTVDEAHSGSGTKKPKSK